MTFNPNVPNPGETPFNFPAQNKTNMERIRDIISSDHEFTATTDAQQGYHNIIHMLSQTAPGAIAGLAQMFAVDNSGVVDVYVQPSVGDQFKLVPAVQTIKGSVAMPSQGAAVTLTSVPNNCAGFLIAYTPTPQTGENIRNYIVVDPFISRGNVVIPLDTLFKRQFQPSGSGLNIVLTRTGGGSIPSFTTNYLIMYAEA